MSAEIVSSEAWILSFPIEPCLIEKIAIRGAARL
jgi:hypothetical protein